LTQASYPFHPNRPALNVLIGLVLSVSASTAYVLYQINVNGLVSRIMGTKPDQFTPDVRFFSSLSTYLLPVLTILLLQMLDLFRFIVEPILALFQ